MGRSLAELVKKSSCVAIIGMEKNAGKTTVLNHLLSSRQQHVQAITSIGYDGEDTDQVTGTDKPTIYIGCGTLVATASGLLGQCDFTRELLSFSGFHTPMGEVVILRALSDGYAQIAGPSTTVQMTSLVKMFQEAGARQIFIDGAAARKSTAAISAADGCILATGAAFSHDIDQIVEQTKHYAELLTLPVFSDRIAANKICQSSMALNDYFLLNKEGQLAGTGDALDEACSSLIASNCDAEMTVVFKGAVTQRFMQSLLEKCRNLTKMRLVAEDGTRFLLTSNQIKELRRRGATMQVKRPANLLAVTVNPVSPDGFNLNSSQICQKLREALLVPVIDVLAVEV